MSLSDAFDAPIVETIGGVTYTLPLLSIDDLVEVSRATLHEQCRKEVDSLPLQDAAGRANVLNYYQSYRPDIDEYCRMALTPGVCEHFVDRSAKKGGHQPLSKLLLAERGWRELAALSKEVSGLWPPNPKRKVASPNVEAAAGPNDVAANLSPNPTPTPQT